MINSKKQIILIILIFTIIISYIRLLSNHQYNFKIVNIPYSIKCAFKEPGCEDGNIDTYSMIHALIFFILGLLFPNNYIIIFIMSIIIELLQPFIGNKARYIINPLISITSYSIGSLIKNKFSNYSAKYSTLPSTKII